LRRLGAFLSAYYAEIKIAFPGEQLERAQVRSSLARRLGMDIGGLSRSERNVEGVVEMMMDATQKIF